VGIDNRTRISLVLTISALLLWASSLIHVRLAKTDDWGLFHVLPLTYFIALGCLTIASAILWFSRESHSKLLFIQTCALITFIWSTPIIIGGTLVGTRYIFASNTLTEYIVRYGHLDPISQWYHNWPGLNLLETALFQISGLIKADNAIIISPFVIQFILLVPVYFLFRTVIIGNQVWAAIWLVYFFNWTGQTIYSPQGIAYILLVTHIGFLIYTHNWTISNRIHQIILLIALVITHLLTAIAGLFIMVTTTCFTKEKKQGLTILILSTVILITWSIYQTTVFFDNNVSIFLEHVFKFDFIQNTSLTGGVTGSIGHQTMVFIRGLFSIVLGTIGIVGGILSTRTSNHQDRLFFALVAGIILMLPFGFYQYEFIERIFLFMLPVLAFFGIKLLRIKVLGIILIMILIVCIPFSVISFYGNQTIDNVSLNQRAYWNFLREKTVSGALLGGGIPPGGWTMGYKDRYLIQFGVLTNVLKGDNIPLTGWQITSMPNYFALSDFEQAYLAFIRNNAESVPKTNDLLFKSLDYNFIYENNEVTTYVFIGFRIEESLH